MLQYNDRFIAPWGTIVFIVIIVSLYITLLVIVIREPVSLLKPLPQEEVNMTEDNGSLVVRILELK